MDAFIDTEVDQRYRIHAEIARHRAACGCELGSAFALVAFLGFVMYVASGHGNDWSWWGTLARGLAWVVTVSVVGKVIGLAYAQVRLVRLRAELRRLPAPTSPSQPHPTRR
jgi:hypothetical protein